jgi:hypothetical protein
MDTESLRCYVRHVIAAVEHGSGYTQGTVTLRREDGGYSVQWGSDWRWFPARSREQAFRAFLDSLAAPEHD